jgi:hypothetical protein
VEVEVELTKVALEQVEVVAEALEAVLPLHQSMVAETAELQIKLH